MKQSAEMKKRWNERAVRDAFFFVETSLWTGDVDAFFALGEERTRIIVDPVLDRFGLDPAHLDGLELGCGVGRFSRALAKRFRTVVGVDVAEEMVLKARELNPEDEFPALVFSVSDGVTLPAAPASVDFVFSYEVFQHMPSEGVISASLREVCRVLRPAGLGLLHFSCDERLLFRFRAGRALYAAVRSAKNRMLRTDQLTTDRTFSGAPPADQKTITQRCREASLQVLETAPDATNARHVFVIVRPSPERTRTQKSER